jgi:hypothetical protein
MKAGHRPRASTTTPGRRVTETGDVLSYPALSLISGTGSMLVTVIPLGVADE